MTNPDHTTIITQWVRAGDLPEMRKGTSTPLDDPIWVSVGDEHPDSNGVRTTTCHLLVNFTGYEDDDGRHIRLEFPDGIPWRRVALD